MDGSFPKRVQHPPVPAEYPLERQLSEVHDKVSDKLAVMDRLMCYELFRLMQQEAGSFKGRRIEELAEEPAWGRGITKIIQLLGGPQPAQPSSITSAPQTRAMRHPTQVSEGLPYESGVAWLYQQALELAAILRTVGSAPAKGQSLVFADGSEFVGPITNGWPSGVGRMTLADGTVIMGEMGPPVQGSSSSAPVSGEEAELVGWSCEIKPGGAMKARSFMACRVGDRDQAPPEGMTVDWQDGLCLLLNGSDIWAVAPDGWQWDAETAPGQRETVSVIIRQDASRRVFHHQTQQQPFRSQGRTVKSSSFGGAASLALALLNAPASRGLNHGDLQDRPLSILRRDFQHHPRLANRQAELAKDAPATIRDIVARADLSEFADLQDEVIADTHFVTELDDPAIRAQVLAESQRRPVMVSGGWPDHAIAYVFFRNTLYICNRGAGSIVMPFVAGASSDKSARLLSSEYHFSFASDQFDDLCGRLTAAFFLPGNRAEQVIYGNEPDSLLTLFAPNWQYSWGDVVKSAQYAQRRGNCALFSPLTATYVSTRLLLDTLLEQQFPDAPLDVRQEAARYLSRRDYRALRNMQRASANLTLQDLRIDLPEQQRIIYTRHHRDAAGNAVLPPAGRGLITDMSDQMLYEGQLKEGKPHGYGQGNTTRGTFEGTWHDGEPDGIGTLTLDDGRIFRGQMTQGKISGPGEMTYLDGEIVTGLFQDGVLQDGRARIQGPQWTYEGWVENAEPSGQGRLTWNPTGIADDRQRLVGTFQKPDRAGIAACAGFFVDAHDQRLPPATAPVALPAPFSLTQIL